MIELSTEDYRNGLKNLANIMRRAAEADTTTVLEDEGLIRRNICSVCGYMWDVTSAAVPDRCPSCRSSLWNSKGLYHHTCKCCTHRWVSRKEKPVRCPGCRSKIWNQDVRKYECCDCGYSQDVGVGKAAPRNCPRCSSENWDYDYIRSACKMCGYIGLLKPSSTGRCPNCRTTMSEEPSMYAPVPKRNKPVEMSEEVICAIRTLNGDSVSYNVNLLFNKGLDPDDAEIVARYMSGEDEVTIACDLDVALGRILKIVRIMNCAGIRRSVA